MRFGYSCHDSFPSADTNTQQTFWTVFEVTRLGAKVDLVIPSIAASADGEPRHVIAEHYGAPVDSLPDGFAVKPLGRRPAEHWYEKGWFDWNIARTMIEGAYDLVWTRDLLAVVSCVRNGIPVVFETYRPDFAQATRFAAWRRVCLSSPFLRGLILHSQVAADAFISAGVPAARCLVAHNGFAPTLMEPQLERMEARARLGLPLDEKLVVYTGHVAPEKGIESLIRTAARVPNARMLIVGLDESLSDASWIEALARNAGARNLLLRPRVPVADVSTYLYAADCLIVPPTDEPLRGGRTVLPMKIFGYLAAGRPIIAPRLPDVTEVLTDGKTACLVTPNDIGEAAGTLAHLLENDGLQSHLAQHARRTAEEYTWEARARRVLDFLCQIHHSAPAETLEIAEPVTYSQVASS